MLAASLRDAPRRCVSAIAARPQISHVVFDFDGTLSWLWHGCPAIVVAVMREHLPRRQDESDAHVDGLLTGIILGLNGRPTIVQMVGVAEVVCERGGPTFDPETLRAEFQRRLDGEIAARSALVRSGGARTDEFVVFGARCDAHKERQLLAAVRI